MKSKMINRIISVITIFILIFILMLFMEKSHNYLIYVLSTLSGLFVIQILFNDYISVQKIGLGKTRKEIRRSVNRKYLLMLCIGLGVISILLLMNLIIYRFDINIRLELFIFLFSLTLASIPFNFVLNLYQSWFRKILELVINVLLLLGSIIIFVNKDLFFISYGVLLIQLGFLFLLRQRGFLVKYL